MSTATIDQQFVEYVVKSLVGNPDAVVIDRTIDEKGVLLTLTVDPEDLGRVIGKRGATAQSLRTLLRALGTKNEARYNLKIVDNGDPEKRAEREQNRASNSDLSSSPNNGNEYNSDNWSIGDDTSGSKSDYSYSNDAPKAESAVERTRRELEDLDDLDV
jgi:uncharacterized protein